MKKAIKKLMARTLALAVVASMTCSYVFAASFEDLQEAINDMESKTPVSIESSGSDQQSSTEPSGQTDPAPAEKKPNTDGATTNDATITVKDGGDLTLENTEGAKPADPKPDEGQPDEGQPDEGQPDEGQPDEGQPDEGQPDEGQPDEGQPDEGQPDEGQTGGSDLGATEIKQPDSQPVETEKAETTITINKTESTANGTEIGETGDGQKVYGYGWDDSKKDTDSKGWGIWAWFESIGIKIQLNEDVKQENGGATGVTIDGNNKAEDKKGVTINLNGNKIDGSGTTDATDKEAGDVIGSDGHNVATVEGKDSSLTVKDGVNITHNAGNTLTQNKDENGNMTAPTFTEGTSSSGRGVEVNGGKLTLDGGKISDNKVGGEIDEKPDDYTKWDGTKDPTKEVGVYNGKVGGGVWVHGGGIFELIKGIISKNAAAEGGGVFVGGDTQTDAKDDPSSFQMKGGTVSDNVAKSGEGGGIYIHASGAVSEKTVKDPVTGKEITTGGNMITGGDITGNATFTTKDLGGGGIYVESNGGKLTILNLVLTGNLAKGMGGGLAGCVHGQTMINIENGSIIYGNTANGEAVAEGHHGPWSNDENGLNGWKIDGHNNVDVTNKTTLGEVWRGEMPFGKDGETLKDYAQDVFSAGNSADKGGIYIPTEMLNGIEPGWTGFVYKDGVKQEIKLAEDGQVVVTGSNVMGLSAHLTADDLKLVKNFLDKVGSENRVLVSGNYSNVHGGGIGNNGMLTIGTKSDEVKGTGVVIEIPTQKNVDNKEHSKDDLGTFGYVDEDDKFAMKGGEFTFELVPAGKDGAYDKDAKVVFDNTNNKDGNVAVRIPSNLINGKGTYTFYLREKAGETGKMEYDGTVYKIEVVVTEGLDTSVGNGGKFTVGDNTITFVKLNATTQVMKQDQNGEWKNINAEDPDAKNPATFTNTYTQDTYAQVKVKKQWADEENKANKRPTSVTVQLYRNGENGDEAYGSPVTLNQEGNWEYDWSKLPLYDENGKLIEWTVKEVSEHDGYTASYSDPDNKLITVTNTYKPEEPPKKEEKPDKPDPKDPDPKDPPVEIPDPEVPLDPGPQIPDEPVDIPDTEVPLAPAPEDPVEIDVPVPLAPMPPVEIPEPQVPLAPAEPVVEIPEVTVPLAEVPKTGDESGVWTMLTVLAGASLLGVCLLERKKEN